MTITVGIDLGTTHSLIAVMDAKTPRLIRNSLDEVLTPSIVGKDSSDRLSVGNSAKELQVTRPESCASVFKRHMGSDWQTKLGKDRFSATELSALVLKSLKADAEADLGASIDTAVITVPAYFNEEQRRATLAAGRMAGLKVDRLLNEPTAAAIAYGLHEAQTAKVAVIIDLGGGTFDVSVVEMFDGVLEVRASAGEVFFGGEDFTNALAGRVLSAHGLSFERTEMEQPLLVSRLRRECEQAKRLLTRQDSAEVRLPGKTGEFPADAPRIVVTREMFEEWTKSILDRIHGPIRRALGDAQLKRTDVDEVILVGGATRMPCVRNRIEELFGRAPRCSINPDEVVALGAAVSAGIIDGHASLTDLVVTDVSPFTLGVEISREIGGQRSTGYFLPVINRNTTIPVSRVSTVTTLEPNQKSVRVAVYQGESRLVKDNVLLGEFTVQGIPPGPPGQEINIRFTYDLNGVLEVEAIVVETQRKASKVFTRHAAGLSAGELEQAVADLQSLKLHPRDDAKNHHLLAWADRLYQELPLRERQLLDSYITGFEEVLEQREPGAIEQYRESFEQFLRQFEDEADAGDGSGDDSW